MDNEIKVYKNKLSCLFKYCHWLPVYRSCELITVGTFTKSIIRADEYHFAIIYNMTVFL